MDKDASMTGDRTPERARETSDTTPMPERPSLIQRCAAVLERVENRLPVDTVVALRRFHAAGEPAELADELVATLVRDKIPISAYERDALDDLLYAFDPPPADYDYIADRETVLTRLVLTPDDQPR